MTKNKLKVLMEHYGITQADIARLSGVSYRTINRIYHQSRTPTPKVQNKITVALNTLTKLELSSKDIFFESGDNNTGPRRTP